MDCMTLVRSHLVNAKPSGKQLTNWYENHCAAWNNPRGVEKGVRLLIEGYAQLADALFQTNETKVGNDGYFHEHAKDLILALVAALNMDTGRFDCGSLDGLVRRLAQVSGVELEP